MTPRFSFEDLILSESVSNEIFDVLMYKQHEQLIFDETKNDDILDTVMHAIEKLLKVATGKYNIR